jgi:hypothetical protein
MPGNWPVLFGKRPTEKCRAIGNSPAAYFTLKASEGPRGPSLSQWRWRSSPRSGPRRGNQA